MIGMFRPWLDITHPKPAQPGELRWYVTAPDGTDMEVDGPTPITFPGETTPTTPLSRTFIPAELSDNPFLIHTNYGAQLDALPEPLRSAIRDGNFMLARQDDQYQVIPTAWVRQAMGRWTPRVPDEVAMSALATDVAMGGDDATTYARRHGYWFDALISEPGETTAEPLDCVSRGHADARRLSRHHRHGRRLWVRCLLTLKNNVQGMEKRLYSFNGANSSDAVTRDRKLKFVNKRAEVWWKFREALEPGLGEPVALPNDPELISDLTAPRWKMTPSGIQIESKDDIRKRLGRSPDKGDAVVMAWAFGEPALDLKPGWARCRSVALGRV
jgi:hypothetical protein